jgi:heme A synthase
MNAELNSFVREALARGLPRPLIRERLLEAGWRNEEVEHALHAYAESDFPVPVPRRRPYLSAQEAFLYLVLFATLYITAFNVGVVLFAVVDRWLPDVTADAYTLRRAAETLRNGIAGLIIALPVFLFVARVIGRALARDSEKRSSPIRKWLTYITLFVAALVLIGDLTFLVQRLLAGDLPQRVLLKALVVFAIAATIFGHYLLDLRSEERDDAAPRRRSPWLARCGVAAVFATIVLGLFTMDSPRRVRLRILDDRRLADLRNIDVVLESEIRMGRSLPRTLQELAARATAKGLTGLRDPGTGAPYEYRLLDSARVELCATFALADSLPEGSESRFWRHPAGRTCYVLDLAAIRPITREPRGKGSGD